MTDTAARPYRDDLFIHALAALALAFSFVPLAQPLAETLDDVLRAETVLGAEILAFLRQDEAAVASAVATVASTAANVQRVQTIFSLENLEIVALQEVDPAAREKVDAALSDAGRELEALRTAVDANPVFYNALDAHNMDAANLIGLDLREGEGATLYMLGREGSL